MRESVSTAPSAPSRARVALAVVLGILLPGLALVSGPAPQARAEEPMCTVSAKLVNSCRPWLGAESGGYGVSGFRARMLEHEARIGRQVDIVHAYLGPGALLHPDIVNLATRPGTIALVNWKPSYRWAEADGRNATVDAQIDNLAASIKALGRTRIMLTVHHEPENDISRGGDPGCPTTPFHGSAGSVSDYVNMWHNVRTRFDDAGVTNVVWVMNYMGWYEWDCVVKSLWPGNDHVDWVMWDPYTKTTSWTAAVGRFYGYLENNSDDEHDFVSKPWGLGEFGYVGSSQSAAYAMYDEARANLANGVHPRLRAYVVWDNHTSSSHDDRVGYTEDGVPDPVEQERYNAFANDPQLTGTAVALPTDQDVPSVNVTSPGQGETLTGAVQVVGTATDAGGVDAVSLRVDGVTVASTAPGPDGAVALEWDSATVRNGTHTLRLRARDASGNVGLSPPVTVSAENLDEEPPTAPAGLTATWDRPSRIALTWSPSSDNNAVEGYRILRDGEVLAVVGPEARSHVDLGVENLTEHAYTVTALDPAGNESEPSAPVTLVSGDDTAPSAPLAEATLTAADNARVAWSESTDNGSVAGYRVHRDGMLVATTDPATRSFLDSGLAQGDDHTYRVSAFDASDNTSPLSAPVTVTNPDVSAPTSPVGLKAVSGATNVALSWGAATDNLGVTGYVVYRDDVPLALLPGSSRAFTDSVLLGTTLHRYHLTALDAAGNEGPASNAVTRSTLDTTPPTAPSGLARTVSGFTVRLTWRAATDNVGVQGYTIYRGGVAIATVAGTAYTDTAAPLAKTSSYVVRARDTAGNVSAASNTVSASVPADRTAPSSPTGLRATEGVRQVALTWSASTDNVGVTRYYLYRNNAKYRLLGNVLAYTDTGLTAGKRYTYKVYALDGASNWSGSSSTVAAAAR